MPFDLNCAPAILQQVMSSAFSELLPNHVQILLDDIIIASKTFEEHLQTLRLVSKRLKEFNFTVNPSKSKFGVPSHKGLGFILLKDDVEHNPTKL